MKTLKGQIQAKLAEKKLKKEQAIHSRIPVYDDVFFEGVKWLDGLAGELVEPQDWLRGSSPPKPSVKKPS